MRECWWCKQVISLVSDSSPALRAIRVLRVLRPLRLIARFGNLRLVVELFVRTLPSVFNVMLVVLVSLPPTPRS